MIYHNPGSEGAVVAFNERYENYIGGQWVAPVKGQYFDNVSPVNGRVFCQIPRSSAEDIDLALDAAQLLAQLVDLVVATSKEVEAAFAGKELDVIDEQDVHAAVALAELQYPVVADGVDHLVHEVFGGHVDHPGPLVMPQDVVADGVDEVGLAEPGLPVDEQGVVRLRGGLRDGDGRSALPDAGQTRQQERGRKRAACDRP